MRWSDFFSNLEYDLTIDGYSPRESPLLDGGDDLSFFDVCSRVKATGNSVAVGLINGDVLHVFPRAVSNDWFSGLVGGTSGAGVVIPLGGLEWVEVSTAEQYSMKTPPVAATLVDVVRDIAQRRAYVTIATCHRNWRGVVSRVGPDFCDVSENGPGELTQVRRIPLRAIVAVYQGAGGWG